MNDFKDLASFAGFSVLTGLSFATTFFSLAFLYSSIEAQQVMNTNALACAVLGVVAWCCWFICWYYSVKQKASASRKLICSYTS